MEYKDRKINGMPIREYKRQWEKKNKIKRRKQSRDQGRIKKRRLVEYLGGKCMKCSYNKCLGILEFHHIKEKSFKMNEKIGNRCSLESLKKEADKCMLLCPNCHRELHHNEYLKKYPLPKEMIK